MKKWFYGFPAVLAVFVSFLVSCESPANLAGVVYTVNYRANGAAGTVPEAQEVRRNEKIRIRDGGDLRFAGAGVTSWNTSADGSGLSYEVGKYTEIRKDITLYAQEDLTVSSVQALADILELLPLNDSGEPYRLVLPDMDSAGLAQVFEAIAGIENPGNLRYVALDFSGSNIDHIEVLAPPPLTPINSVVELSLPATVDTLEGGVFYYCEGLRDVYLSVSLPPASFNLYAFYTPGPEEIIIHVPEGSEGVYQGTYQSGPYPGYWAAPNVSFVGDL